MKLKLHPLFLLFSLILIIYGQGVALFYGIVAVVLHELGHKTTAKYYGYYLKEIKLLPYGAVISGEENIDKKSERIIAISGPVVSLLIAIIFIAFWWIIPTSYYYTKGFVYTNLGIFFVNLIPVYPLDGARFILTFSKNRLKALKILRILGVIFSFIFMILFIVSAFYDINFTLGIFAIFLFVGATSGTKKESENYVLNSAFIVKDYQSGVEGKKIYITSDALLLKLVKLLSPKTINTYIIVDSNSTNNVISEEKLEELVKKYPIYTKIKDIYFWCKCNYVSLVYWLLLYKILQ